MVKVGKRAQNWSLEIIIALSVFLVIFVMISVFLFYSPENSARDLDLEAQKMMSTLENDLLVDGNEIKSSGLNELSSYDCEQLQDLFSAKGEVCIHFEDLDGSLIEVNGKTSIGCEGIKLNKNGTMLCGGSTS